MIVIVVAPDGDRYLAMAQGLDVFGFGDTEFNAAESFRQNLKEYYYEVMKGSNFSGEMLEIKKYLLGNPTIKFEGFGKPGITRPLTHFIDAGRMLTTGRVVLSRKHSAEVWSTLDPWNEEDQDA